MKRFLHRLEMPAAERESWHAGIRALCGEGPSIFTDIETTGFSRTYDSVYLIGMLYEDGEGYVLEQLLAESIAEEPDLLTEAAERFRDFQYGITYNGDMFDFPFLKERGQRLWLDAWPLSAVSVDLLRRYRPYASFFGWPNMKLKTLERSLGICREDVFDGGALIEVYHEYARTGDERLEKILLLHNYEDLLNMPPLLRIEDMWRRWQSCRILGAEVFDEEIRLTADTIWPMGIKASLGGWQVELTADEPRIYLRCQPESGCRRYYLPNYQDYYYLPQTEEIVHKSLAGGIASRDRKKATRAVCYLSREGQYVPGWGEPQPGLRLYRCDVKDKTQYFEYTELTKWLQNQSEKELTEWLRGLQKKKG